MKQAFFIFLILTMAARPSMLRDTSSDFTPTPEDLHGQEFTVLQPEPTQFFYDLAPDELNGHIVNDAAYHTKSRLEEFYNIILDSHKSISAFKDYQMSVFAADPRFDAAFLTLPDAMQTVAGGYNYNFAHFNELHPDAPWWAGSDAFSIDGGQFALVSAADLTALSKAQVMVFTDRSLEEDLYKTVARGNWTLDAMERLIKENSGSIDGGANAATSLLYASGQTFLPRDESGRQSLMLTAELMDTVDRLANIFAQNGTASPLFTVKSLEDVGADGFVPLPKADGKQREYIAPVTHDAQVMVMPLTNCDPEQTAMIADTFSAFAYDITKLAYMEQLAVDAAGSRMAKNSQKYMDMLGYIEGNIVFDPAISLSKIDKVHQQLGEIIAGGDNFIASTVALHQRSVAKSLDDFYNTCIEFLNYGG